MININMLFTNQETNESTEITIPHKSNEARAAAEFVDGIVDGLNDCSEMEWELEEEGQVWYGQVSYIEHDGDDIILTVQLEEASS